MDHSTVQTWIDTYVGAWRSPGTAALASLFTPDVSYTPSPWKQPLTGLEELSSFWETARTSHNEAFELQSRIIAVEGNTAVVRIEVSYADNQPSRWRDIWIMSFTSKGLCRSFEEWPFYPDQDDGQAP